MLYKSFTVGDKEYKARLTAKACVDLEKKMGTNPLNLFAEMANNQSVPKMEDLLTILQASLTTYQHGMTMDSVYELYDAMADDGMTIMDLIPLIMDIFKVSGFFSDDANKEDKSKNA